MAYIKRKPTEAGQCSARPSAALNVPEIFTDPPLSWGHFVPNYTFLITICVTKLCVRPLLSTLLMKIEKQKYFSFPRCVCGWFSGSPKGFHTWTICTYRFSLCWSLIMQLVCGQNESESIVTGSPQSSLLLLLLFSVKGMHHRAGSAERLRLTVYGIPS